VKNVIYRVIGKKKAERTYHCDVCGAVIKRGDEFMLEKLVSEDTDTDVKRSCYSCALDTDLGEHLFHPEIRASLPRGQMRLNELLPRKEVMKK